MNPDAQQPQDRQNSQDAQQHIQQVPTHAGSVPTGDQNQPEVEDVAKQGELRRVPHCYYCHRPLQKGVKMHCDNPGCDICANPNCMKGRR